MWFLRESLILLVCVCACFCEEKDAERKLKRMRNIRIRHNHQDPSSRPPEELAQESDSRTLFSWDILSASSTDQLADKITNNASRNDPAPPSNHSSQHRARDGVKRRRNKRRRAKTTPDPRQGDATVATPELDVDALHRAKEQRRRDRKQKGNKQKERKNNRKNSGEARHQRGGKKKLKDTLLIGQKIVNKTLSRNAEENEIEMKVYDENKSVDLKAETTTTTVGTATEVFAREDGNDLRAVEGGMPRNYQDVLAERNRKLAAERGNNEAIGGEENVIPTDRAPTTALPDTHVTDDNVVPLLPSPGRGKARRPCKGSRRGGCEQICTEVGGRPVCSCYKGFRSHGNKCRDINECATDNGSCQEGCRNTLGSFHCTCPAGFRITDDDRSCRDVNECLLRNGHGPCQDRCTNTLGTYTCSCEGLPGTQLAADRHRCLDLDECLAGNGGCSHLCLNTLGNVFCLCPPGMALGMDWKTCHDIDECQTDDEPNDICPEKCVNTIGSYHCAKHLDCGPGYFAGTSECQDIDECQTSDCSQSCTNTDGSYHCSCHSGFNLLEDGKTCEKEIVCSEGFRLVDSKCEDVDECEDNDCSQGCTNTNGSYHCSCDNGFKLLEDGKTCEKEIVCSEGFRLVDSKCEDVDECEDNDCSQGCINTNGSYHCSCDNGFRMQDDEKTCLKIICPAGFKFGIDECEDVDECEESDCSQQCTNTNGSYFCSCDFGFRLQNDQKTCLKIVCPAGYKLGDFECEDINECHNNDCSHFCVNTNGSYYCSCEDDFTLQNDEKTCLRNLVCPEGFKAGTFQCEDVDECENSDCSQGCVNTNGSYHCTCEYGFRLQDDQKTCLKIICPEGYKLGSSDCEDINECHHNHCSQRCTNTEGSYHCSCEYGFRLQDDKKTCLKIICPEGYKLGAFDCEDINECSHNYCSQLCTNTNGSYHCSCKHGFTLQKDKTTCVRKIVCPEGFKLGRSECEDIDECRNSDCQQLCINTNGSYHCACKLGYVLKDDRKSCSQGALTAVCPPLDIPAHGYLECYRLSLRAGPWRHRVVNHSGSVCKLRCPIGFKLEGVYRRFCGQTGKWLGLSYGSCERLPEV